MGDKGQTDDTDWGVPDWSDEGAYEALQDLDNSHWRWEFLRRRQDVREDWLENAETTYEVNLKRTCDPEDPIYQATVFELDSPRFRADVPNCLLKYNLAGLPNPAISKPYCLMFRETIDFTSFSNRKDVSKTDIETSIDPTIKQTVLEDAENHRHQFERLAFESPEFFHIRAPIRKGVEWIFDLTKPLAPQLREAKKELNPHSPSDRSI